VGGVREGRPHQAFLQLLQLRLLPCQRLLQLPARLWVLTTEGHAHTWVRKSGHARTPPVCGSCSWQAYNNNNCAYTHRAAMYNNNCAYRLSAAAAAGSVQQQQQQQQQQQHLCLHAPGCSVQQQLCLPPVCGSCSWQRTTTTVPARTRLQCTTTTVPARTRLPRSM
jgi:hypothetical protein